MEKPKFRIGFDINGVLRNTVGKIEQTYDKFYLSQTDGVEDENDFQYEMNLPVTSLELKEKGYETELFPADWKTHGRKAGPIRNKQMADYGEMLIAFWDGKSSGTKNMIENSKKLGLIVHIINY